MYKGTLKAKFQEDWIVNMSSIYNIRDQNRTIYMGSLSKYELILIKINSTYSRKIRTKFQEDMMINGSYVTLYR